MASGGLTRQVAAKKLMQLERNEKKMEGSEKQYLAKLVKPVKHKFPKAPKRPVKRVPR